MGDEIRKDCFVKICENWAGVFVDVFRLANVDGNSIFFSLRIQI